MFKYFQPEKKSAIKTTIECCFLAMDWFYHEKSRDKLFKIPDGGAEAQMSFTVKLFFIKMFCGCWLLLRENKKNKKNTYITSCFISINYLHDFTSYSKTQNCENTIMDKTEIINWNTNEC